ncbi:MAG: NAD(P)/FAD-dependent oxidoreductase [Candidatus Omnitrophica bacterium]|nr:NAD(P)/FAD-dependent oxidoreductase [Candidatus Omnitrophota bacterium]
MAKAGMKVLIVERNNKVGGYCGSFKRNGFIFDTGVHALEGCGPNGILNKIIQDLGINSLLKIKRIDPSDVIITSFGNFNIRNDIKITINEWTERFPRCKDGIQNIFGLILNKDFVLRYPELKKITFDKLLKRHVKDKFITTLLSVLFVNVGLPINRLSAVNGLIFLNHYLSDGGYYPEGGMQGFVNVFQEKFKSFGGTVLLNTTVNKIFSENKCVRGVVIANNNIFESKYVISNCDATQTYLNLIDNQETQVKYKKRLGNMVTSASVFMVSLGLKKDIYDRNFDCGALWYLRNEDENAGLEMLFKNKTNYNSNCIMIAFPSFHDNKLAPVNKSSIYLMCNANFKNAEYWKENEEKVANELIGIAEKVVPLIKNNIEVKLIATPQTLYKYTLNKNGAMHGWASLVSQIDPTIIPRESDIKNLFFVGHWITHPGQGGIPMVAKSAYNLVNIILSKSKQNAFMEKCR